MAIDFAALLREERARLERERITTKTTGPVDPSPGGASLEAAARSSPSSSPIGEPPALPSPSSAPAGTGTGGLTPAGVREAPLIRGEVHPELPLRLRAESGVIDLARFCVRGCPVPGLFFVPDFLSEAEERALLACVHDPVYRASGRWVELRRRQLQNFGGRPTVEGLRDREPLPAWLAAVGDALVGAGLFPEAQRPNHVLVNLYRSGEGIFPHTDGSAYFPQVCTLSLGAMALMHFRPRVDAALVGTETHRCLEDERAFQVCLPPRSCIVLREGAYFDLLHSIEPLECETVTDRCLNTAEAGVRVGDTFERHTRVSLTVRHVPDRPVLGSGDGLEASGEGTGRSD